MPDESANAFDNLTFSEAARQYVRDIAHMMGETMVTRATVTRVLQRALGDEHAIMRARTKKKNIYVGTSIWNARVFEWPPGQ